MGVDNNEVHPPAAMVAHDPKEFRFAYRVLCKMVMNSEFFPERASSSDWFRPRDREAVAAADDDANDDDAEYARFLEEISGKPSRSLAGLKIDCQQQQQRPTTKKSSAKRSPSFESDSTIATTSTSGVSGSSSRLLSPGFFPIDSPPSTADRHRRLSLNMSAVASLGLPLVTGGEKPMLFERRRSSFDDAPFIDRSNFPKGRAAAKEAAELFAPVPAAHERDVDYGEVLGRGGFCEVRLASLRGDVNSSCDGQPRCYAMKYLTPPNSNTKTKGTKAVDKSVKQFQRGIADLAIEARFLSLLSHENIISLHYVGERGFEEQYNCGEGDYDRAGGGYYRHKFGYFLLLDPLHETLAKRIEMTYIPEAFSCVNMSSAPPAKTGLLTGLVRRNHARADCSSSQLNAWRTQLANRLENLKGIASALQYIHDDCRVIYRDIKPDNIGFYLKPRGGRCHCSNREKQQGHSFERSAPPCCTCCHDEVPKLFDFGLAKELKSNYLKPHPHHADGHGTMDTYKLTAKSGSRRYMAPEVAFSTPYNDRADVYGFGMVLYQTASLATPFDGWSLVRHEEEVLSRGARPDVRFTCTKKALAKARDDSSYVEWLAETSAERRNERLAYRTKCVWTKDLKKLIEDCWHDDMRCRPCMKEVVTRLEGCIQDLTAATKAANQVVAVKSSSSTKYKMVSAAGLFQHTLSSRTFGRRVSLCGSRKCIGKETASSSLGSKGKDRCCAVSQ